MTLRKEVYDTMNAIWEILSEFLIFCNFSYEPSGEWNNSKIWEIRKIFVNIAGGKYLSILQEATCDNYFIVELSLKSNVSRVILLTC